MGRDYEWRYDAKCRGEDTEIFFPPRDKEKYQEIASRAKGICYGRDGRPECPVRISCLTEALDNDEEHGIFGGMSHRERNALVRKYQAKKKAGKAKSSLQDFIKNGGAS